MKKIFAIALALVMVLSMASAFATYCNWEDWSCEAEAAVKCGKATVEVLPYVRSATACGFEFAANDCAAAIKGENVYFAVKLTVDADVNQDWWNAATLSLKGTDVDAGWESKNLTKPAWQDVKKGGVFYLKATSLLNGAAINDASSWANDVVTYGWDKEDADFTFGEKNVFSAKAAKSSAKVCATLESKLIVGTQDQIDAGEANARWYDVDVTVGKYNIQLEGDKSNGDAEYFYVEWADKSVAIYLDKDNKVDFAYVGKVKLDGYTNLSATAFESSDNKEYSFTCNEGATLKEVFDFLKIDFDTCITYAGVSNNFGWNDKVVSCTSYKKAGMAVVDADCVVAIPKTGDASVLAWLF